MFDRTRLRLLHVLTVGDDHPSEDFKALGETTADYLELCCTEATAEEAEQVLVAAVSSTFYAFQQAMCRTQLILGHERTAEILSEITGAPVVRVGGGQ